MADAIDSFVATSTMQRARSAPSSQGALPPQVYKDGREQRHPIVYKPDGSFQSLVVGNKMAPTDVVSQQGEYARAIRQQKKYLLPGTTTYIRGHQHVAGRTYGEAARRNFDTDYLMHVQTSPIPSNPEKNRKIEHVLPAGSFVTHHFGDKPYHIPGYTGHVTGVRDQYAVTYGNMTNTQMKNWSRTNPREYPGQVDGYAKTIKPRHFYTVNSNPLPGGVLRTTAPVKLVPGHLNRLQYY